VGCRCGVLHFERQGRRAAVVGTRGRDVPPGGVYFTALSSRLASAGSGVRVGGEHVRVRVSPDSGSPALTLEVQDTGIGIPPDEVLKIWDRLFRGDRSRSERGLGPRPEPVRAIVEAHGGESRFNRRPAPARTFKIELPVDGRKSLV